MITRSRKLTVALAVIAMGVGVSRRRPQCESVTALVCQATGGSCEYHGRGMKESHAHLKITEREWDRMLTIFEEVLATHRVPEKETQELLDIVGSTKADIVIASGSK